MPEAAAIATALALTAAAGTPGAGPWIVTCNMAGPGESPASANAQRVFRIGPHLFQEWKPEKNAFGRNLCVAFSCIGAQDRLEGVISSPTLSLTVTLEPATGRASWRALGATGLKTTSGPCAVRLEAAAAKAAG